MINNVSYSGKYVLEKNIQLGYSLDIPFIAGQGSVSDNKLDDGVIKSLLTAQYLRAIKDVIKSYENSPLPDKFIVGQNILITKIEYSDVYGMFKLAGDSILVDPDAISDIYSDLPSRFLFGHEMGHKIAKYRADEELYKELANILGIGYYGNKYLLEETYADECGNLMIETPHQHHILKEPLNVPQRDIIRQLILKSAYK